MKPRTGKWVYLSDKVVELLKDESQNLTVAEVVNKVKPVGISRKEYQNLYSFVKNTQKRVIKEKSSFDSTTETSSSGYDENVENDLFSQWAKDRNLDISTVKSAKLITHLNKPDTFNVVLDFDGKPVNVDKIFLKLEKQLSVEPIALPPIPHKSNDKVLVVYFSDEHVGLSTRSNNLYGKTYNSKVFGDRVDKVLEEIRHVVGEEGVFDRILIAQMGDEIDHWDKKTTRGGHELITNLSNEEAHDVWVEVKIKFFDKLVQLNGAKEIHFFGCANSNHSGKGVSYIAFRHLSTYLKLRYPFIKTHIEKKFMEFYEYGIHNFLFTHGKDEEFMFKAFPLHLDEKTGNLLRDFKDYHGKRNIRVVKGDLHQISSDAVPGITYRNVPSLCGISDYTNLNFGNGIAGVGFDIAYKNKDKVLSWDMYF